MAEKENLPSVAEEAAQEVVKRGRGRKPFDNFGQEYTKPGDNSKYLRLARVAVDLPPVDVSDPKQVQERIETYLDFCEDNDQKPNMVGLSLWLGVDRATLKRWKCGDLRKDTHQPLIERYTTLLEDLWIQYMMNGKTNPASGIFIAKNLFGYKDTQDIVVTPHTPLGEETDEAKLESKYAESVIDTTATTVDDI